jgi:hypothetical protein
MFRDLQQWIAALRYAQHNLRGNRRLSLRDRTLFLQGGLQSTRELAVPEYVEPVTGRRQYVELISIA